MIKKPGTIKTFEELNSFLRDFYANFGTDDLKPAGVRTSAPTVDQLNPGQELIVEISGVPWKYYKTLSGTLYKIQMTAA